jgi:polar amino acid transport system substrate-binding protein
VGTIAQGRCLAALACSIIVVAACRPVIATPIPSPRPTPVAIVPETDLITLGSLKVCADLSRPPRMSQSPELPGEPFGWVVDIVLGIDQRLGFLQLEFADVPGSQSIEALRDKRCDVVADATAAQVLGVTDVELLPYYRTGQVLLVEAGNPSSVETPTDLCGAVIGVRSGSVEESALLGTGQFSGRGLITSCPIRPRIITGADVNALLPPASGISVYFADLADAGWLAADHADAVDLVDNLVLNPTDEGFLVGTWAPGLGSAIQAALRSLAADGDYRQILSTYWAESGAIDL